MRYIVYLVLATALLVAGCGDIEWFPDGRIPNNFSFASKTGVLRSTPIESDTVTITGNLYPTSISVENGEYRIDEGAYTSQPGKISSGQKVTLRHISATTFNTSKITSVTIGGMSAFFSSTTGDAPVSPVDEFSFPSQVNVEPNMIIVSDPTTITGTGFPHPINVQNGEYSLDSTTVFTTAAGTINAGQVVRVRHPAAAGSNQSRTTTVTIEKQVGSFTSVTKTATTPPFTGYSTVTGITQDASRFYTTTNPTAVNPTINGATTFFSLQFRVSSTETSAPARQVLFVVAGLNSSNQKIHPGYYSVTASIPANSRDFAVTIQNLSLPTETYNKITQWVFKAINASP